MEQASNTPNTPAYIRNAQADIRKALADADSFISGFDGDDLQEPGSIEALRATIAKAQHLLTPATLDADAPDRNSDIDVFSRDMLDAEHAALQPQPWLAQEPGGTIHGFDTEDDACAFQRGYRVALGLDPMTGEPT